VKSIPFGSLKGELAELPRFGRWAMLPDHLASDTID
jgi:hypothetical protein